MGLPAKVISMEEHRKPGPHLEDGYIRIANELFDAVLKKLTSYRHIKVVLAILRKTYGYQKKEDDITISQLAELTGIHRNNVGAAIKDLEQMRVIVNDPGAPQAEHFGALKELIGYWDAYTIRKAALAEDESARGRDRMERFKTQFSAALEGYVAEHPEVRSFWLSVLRPEAGFD